MSHPENSFREPAAPGAWAASADTDPMLRFVRVMSVAMDAGDPFTRGRGYRCSRYALRLARSHPFDEAARVDLECAALLQDIGKKALLHGILEKRRPLTDAERDRMATHSQISQRILEEIPFLRGAATVVGCLNERFDGQGSPTGLVGRQIPLASRILALVSALDAMTSDRPYRAGLSAAETYRELRREAGTRFDPDLVEEIIALHASGELHADLDADGAFRYLDEQAPTPRPGTRAAA